MYIALDFSVTVYINLDFSLTVWLTSTGHDQRSCSTLGPVSTGMGDSGQVNYVCIYVGDQQPGQPSTLPVSVK